MSSKPLTNDPPAAPAPDRPAKTGSDPAVSPALDHWGVFLAEQRPVMTDLLARQQDNLTGLEERLAQELALLSEAIRGELLAEMSDERAALVGEQEALKKQERELARVEEETATQLQEWSEELSRRQAELEQREESFAPREAELATRLAALTQAETLLKRERAELLAESQELAAREARLTEREQTYTIRQEHLNEAIQDTLAQRQRIAAAFAAQRKLQAATLAEERQEIEIFRETLDRESQRTQAALQQQAAVLQQQSIQREQQHEQQLAALRSSQEELAAGIRHWQELCAAQHALVGELQATRQQLHQNLVQLQQEQQTLESQRTALAAKETELSAREAQLTASCGTLAADQLAVTEHNAAWTSERSELLQRIAALEADAAKPAATVVDAAAQAELEQLRAERQALQAKLREAELNQAGTQTQAAQIRALEAERDGLAAKLAAAEQQAHTAEEKLTQQAAFEDDPQRIAELQKRMELAIEDVRTLKRKNAELEASLDKARRAGGAVETPDAGGWEAMKQKMLAQLESQDSGLEPGDRREIEATLRRTDEIVAAKEREIADLRELLEQQSNQVGELAVGAAAIAQIMDHDELIMAERERLQHAQEEWREKLRQAEVEISLERARIARERTELQEKQHALEKLAAQQTPPSGETKPGDKPGNRGRWLTRLGLKDEK
jgi:hypothetical protein